MGMTTAELAQCDAAPHRASISRRARLTASEWVGRVLRLPSGGVGVVISATATHAAATYGDDHDEAIGWTLHLGLRDATPEEAATLRK